jgi:hypothetical protein
MIPLRDKREGACRPGPCRMPRRCWSYENCYLYAKTPKPIKMRGCDPEEHGGY